VPPHSSLPVRVRSDQFLPSIRRRNNTNP